MKRFEIRKLDNSYYDYLILSTSYINPLQSISDIEQTLKAKNIRILFDLLLSNGNSENRFIEATFNGQKLDNFRECNNVDVGIRKEAGLFYQQNTNLLNNSVLSRPTKFLISKGKL